MGDIKNMAEILAESWIQKRSLSQKISNSRIDEIHDLGISAGAYAGKISGAGGGGVMFFVSDPVHKIDIINSMKSTDVQNIDYLFTDSGCHGWTIGF